MSAPCTLQRRGAVTVAIVGSGAIEVRAGRWSESLIALETLIMNDNSGVRSEIRDFGSGRWPRRSQVPGQLHLDPIATAG